MPVFINIANIVVEKSTIARKYNGGIDQFKIDYSFGPEKRHQEDDKLFSIAFMGIDDSEIKYLISKGLSFDNDTKTSEDFVIVYMHGGGAWKVNWLDCNATFAWHKQCASSQIKRAQEIENMLMNDIYTANERGENLFETISHKYIKK